MEKTTSQKCRYCGSDQSERPERCYRSSPFCNGCLDERITAESERLGPFEVWYAGSMAVVVPIGKTTRVGASGV